VPNLATTSFTVRLARQDDAPEVVRVIKAVYDEYGFTWDAEEYHADLYDLQGHYIDHGCPFFVAELEDGRLAGTAAVELFDPIPGPPSTLTEKDGRVRIAGTDCSMERLYVDPETRRLGIGRALAQELITSALAHRKSLMEIWSDKRFVKAHALYESMGAKQVGDRICHDPDQSPEWGLSLEISDVGSRISNRK
jgi:GNAT superfamily N-acetyltransferase